MLKIGHQNRGETDEVANQENLIILTNQKKHFVKK